MSKLRVEMHSPPKENTMSKFQNDNFTVFACFCSVGFFTALCIAVAKVL